MPPNVRFAELWRYLTGIMLNDSRLDKYFHLLDTKIFWGYKKVWDYVIKHGRGNEPDLTDICFSCWITDTTALMELAYEVFTWDPVRYLKEAVARYNYSDPTKLSMEFYEETVKLLEEIDNIREWEQEAQYTLQSIASEMMDETYSETRKPIPTLIKELDSILWGWVPVGWVTRITAYSNTGKSKFAYFIASNLLKQWKKILFINLEVPRDVVLQSILASYSWEHLNDIRKWQGTRDIWDYLNEYIDLPLKIVDNKRQWSEIKKMAEMNKPDVLFIDFIQNIKVEWNNIYEKMSELAVEIQSLAIDNNIAIIDISQMSNEWAKTYKIGDMIPSKWGGELVASADVWLVITSHESIANHLNLYIAKNKFGEKEKCIELRGNFYLNQFSVIDVTSHKANFGKAKSFKTV